MSCVSLVDVGLELTTLFEFQFFQIRPPKKCTFDNEDIVRIRACIKR